MWCGIVRGFQHELLALFHAKTVLFIDNYETEIFELGIVSEKGVGADYKINFAIFDFLLLLWLFLGGASEKGGSNTKRFQGFFEGFKVLSGKNGGRGKQSHLGALARSGIGGESGYHGLTGADVALQEAVHRCALL